MEITTRDLLRDDVYRRWMAKRPHLPEGLSASHPWYVYVFRSKVFMVPDDADPTIKHAAPKLVWSRAAKASYTEAYSMMRDQLRRPDVVLDVVIVSRVVEFKRPVDPRRGLTKKGFGRPWDFRLLEPFYDADADYRWCVHCRRPTRYRYYTKHHALRGLPVASDRPRCEVCGIGARA